MDWVFETEWEYTPKAYKNAEQEVPVLFRCRVPNERQRLKIFGNGNNVNREMCFAICVAGIMHCKINGVEVKTPADWFALDGALPIMFEEVVAQIIARTLNPIDLKNSE